VVKNGAVTKVVWGTTHTAKPAFDINVEKDLSEYFDKYHTIQLDNFMISDDEMTADGYGSLVTHESKARAN